MISQIYSFIYIYLLCLAQRYINQSINITNNNQQEKDQRKSRLSEKSLQ